MLVSPVVALVEDSLVAALVEVQTMQPTSRSLYKQLSQRDQLEDNAVNLLESVWTTVSTRQLILRSLTRLLSWSTWILENVGVSQLLEYFASGPYRIRISPSLILDSDVCLCWSLVCDCLNLQAVLIAKTAWLVQKALALFNVTLAKIIQFSLCKAQFGPTRLCKTACNKNNINLVTKHFKLDFIIPTHFVSIFSFNYLIHSFW